MTKKPGSYTYMPKTVLLLFISTLFFISANSQALLFGDKIKWEAGVNFGPSFYLGDLGGNSGKGSNGLKDINMQFTKMMKGVFVTMYPSKLFGLRLAVNLTYLEGDDAVINTTGINELWRKQRNLDFRSTLIEGYAAVEVFPTLLLNLNDEFEPRLRPYVLAGVGAFHFNPQGSLKDAAGNKTWYYLHPLRLEGQGMSEYPYSKPYSLTQVNIPLGAGLKMYVSERVNMSAEILYRKTFTDYIDDVSKNYIDANNYIKYLPANDASLAYRLSDKTIGIIYPGMTRFPAGTMRGDTKNADTYFSVLGKIGFRLGPVYENSFARRAAMQRRCPKVF